MYVFNYIFFLQDKKDLLTVSSHNAYSEDHIPLKKIILSKDFLSWSTVLQCKATNYH